MKVPETPDLAVAGLVVLLALIAFVAVLYLNRDAAGSKKARGTVFTNEGGKSVRRSTRARKSVLPDEVVLSTPIAAPKVRKARAQFLFFGWPRQNNVNNGPSTSLLAPFFPAICLAFPTFSRIRSDV